MEQVRPLSESETEIVAAQRARMDKARRARMAKLEARRNSVALAQEAKERALTKLADPTQSVQMSEHTWLGKPGASLYIPAWYKPHELNYAVTQNEKELGFRVADVLPHRRWAIKEAGELLLQEEFERLYERYIGEISPQGIDVKVQSIPRVERYVNKKPDPSGGPGFVEITFDPSVPAPASDNGVRYDPIKDVIWSLQDDMERRNRLEQKANLASMLARKEINGETFERRMRELEMEDVRIAAKAEPDIPSDEELEVEG